MKVKSIAECSLGAFCNTFDHNKAIIGLQKNKNQLLVFLFEYPYIGCNLISIQDCHE